ncbi:hypothetical protein CKAH01_00657 [Colletotrichum kahawae]|uniref:Uncharacterized protein n=1 Tax=Colletotrichum kahawae TaxID=34407 RepID=A0AAD9YK12_COLKA|nr:hypothetical protein CKAH01_00657 [Colletotrichum kahawae]
MVRCCGMVLNMRPRKLRGAKFRSDSTLRPSNGRRRRLSNGGLVPKGAAGPAGTASLTTHPCLVRLQTERTRRRRRRAEGNFVLHAKVAKVVPSLALRVS